jgi:hypothetical protein
MHRSEQLLDRVNEHLAEVLFFSMGRPVIEQRLGAVFEEGHIYDPLRNKIGIEAERRADRALLQMATQLRLFDDNEGLNEILKGLKPQPLGTVVQGDGKVTELFMRDMTNKVMHGAGFQWHLENADDPSVVCVSADEERWKSAEIKLLAVAAFVNRLAV